MTKKTIRYNGNDVFAPLNFNLYPYEDIEFEETKNKIYDDFVEVFQENLVSLLKELGLKFIELKWFSPREYNYAGDSLDLIISIEDKSKLKTAILKNKNKIDELLAKNTSYDGYMSLAVFNVVEELKCLKENEGYKVDSIVLNVLLSPLNFNENFSITDSFINSPTCESCGNTLEDEEVNICQKCIDESSCTKCGKSGLFEDSICESCFRQRQFSFN